MDVGLIGASIRSSEKRRIELTPKVLKRQRQLALGQDPDQDAPTSPTAELVDNGETPDQTAFRQSMGAVLHNRPLEDFQHTNNDAPVRIEEDAEMTSTGSLLSIVHPNFKTDMQKAQDSRLDLGSYLAYSSVSDLEDEACENRPGTIPSRKTDNGPRRLLDFRMEEPEIGSNSLWVDPFQHNVHEVIQRAKSSNQELSFGDDKSTSKVPRRKIAEKPTKVLDAPDIVDDYCE